MRTLDLILYVLAIACFLAAALLPGEPEHNARVRLIGLGLAFLAIVPFAALLKAGE